MGILYYKTKPVIGLDIEQTGIKVMSIDSKRTTVSAYGSIDLDPIRVEESLKGKDNFLEQNLKTLLSSGITGSLPSSHAVVSVPTAKTFTRTFAVPVASERNLNDIIELEVEQYIPIPADALYVDYEITTRTAETIHVSLSAVPRLLVDSLMKAFENNDLEVCMIEPSINAVARLLKSTERGELVTVIIDIGPASTDIGVLDGDVKVTGSIGVGGNTFTLDIAKRMKISLENAHQLKVLNGLSPGPRQKKLEAALVPNLDKILTETRKVIRYYNERLANEKTQIEQVLIVGGGSNVPGIGEFFTNALVMPARVANPWQNLNFGALKEPAKQIRPRYLTVAGLASINPSEIV